jgi:hypothetical protein
MGPLKLKVAAGVICIAAGFLFFAGFSQEHNGPNVFGMEAHAAITAIPVQLGRESYGLAMIDAETQTLWIYEFNTRGQAFDQLRLIAARSFEYDRKLTEWNTAAPTPTQVKKILEAMQTQQEQKQEKKIEELQQVLEQD